jgi:tetratricopeptide (TPR) repeat protein
MPGKSGTLEHMLHFPLITSTTLGAERPSVWRSFDLKLCNVNDHGAKLPRTCDNSYCCPGGQRIYLPRAERMLVEGQYYESLSDHEKAASTYRALFELFPDNVEYGLLLAISQDTAGHANQAIETIARLRRLPAPASDDPRIDMAEVRAIHDNKQAQLAVHGKIQGLLGFVFTLLLIAELVPCTRQHGMSQREFWVGMAGLLQKISCGQRIKLAQLDNSKSVEPRRIAVRWQRSGYADLIRLIELGNAQATAKLFANTGHELKQVLSAAYFCNL